MTLACRLSFRGTRSVFSDRRGREAILMLMIRATTAVDFEFCSVCCLGGLQVGLLFICRQTVLKHWKSRKGCG